MKSGSHAVLCKNKVLNVMAILWVGVALFCYLMYAHYDLLVTAHQACTYLTPAFRHFYSINHQITGSYSANYFPSVYLLFAVWNIPLALLGVTPQYWGDWTSAFALWNKLLVILFFVATCWLLYRIALRLKFSPENSKLAVFLFAGTPVGFFSIFITGQYDIITLFFILLGFYYWLDSDNQRSEIKFVLALGIASTFKLFAALVFMVLLLTKHKNVYTILRYILCFIVPMILVSVPYLLFDREAFLSDVVGFNVIDYVKIGTIDFGGSQLQIFPFLICMLFAYAYFHDVSKEDMAYAAVHYACGVFAAMFGFFNWYPQWMLLSVPFLILGTLASKNTDVYLWLDIVLGVAFVLLVVNRYADYMDENLMRNGILSGLLKYKEYSTDNMASLFKYDNTDLLFTIISVIFCCNFIFKNPAHEKDDINTLSLKELYVPIALRFAIPIGLFIWGSMCLLPSMIERPARVWVQDEDVAMYARADEVAQTVTLPCEQVERVEIYTKTAGDIDQLQLVIEDENGVVVGRRTLAGDSIADEGYTSFNFGHLDVSKTQTYRITMHVSGAGEVLCGVADSSPYHIKFYDVVNQNYDQDKLSKGQEILNDQFLKMGVYGW